MVYKSQGNVIVKHHHIYFIIFMLYFIHGIFTLFTLAFPIRTKFYCSTKIYLCECYWVIYVVLHMSLTAYYPILHQKVTNHILLDDMSPTTYYPMLHEKATNYFQYA